MYSHGFIDRAVFDRQTLLLAEDCEDDAEIMRNALLRAGVPNPLQIVQDGEEAIDYLAGKGKYERRDLYPLPIMFFLDLNMPKQGGLEVLSWVRQHSRLSLLAVHILSASSREADISRATELGANSYIIKPSKYSDLVDMLKAWYTLSRFQALIIPRELR
ncbi:MAG TPA: response regulator [Verrucomicrobiae bacterium]|nr:response regulator [Verrucomicrobiae bacterium]